MAAFTTRIDEIGDTGTVDIGYHYGLYMPPPKPLDADINFDYHVDFLDYAMLAEVFYLCGDTRDMYYVTGNITKDDCVDENDLGFLVDWWLNCFVTPASSPNPLDGATLLSPDTDLSWSAGKYAILHDVYLGTDLNAVALADRESPEFMGSVPDTNFDPSSLELYKDYYWRIDEVGPACAEVGEVWSFTTLGEPNNHLVGWWKFDEGAGTVAYDSAASNDGTLMNGPTWAPGFLGGALHFDGNNDYVDCGSPFASVASSDNKTIMAWVSSDIPAWIQDVPRPVITMYRKATYEGFGIFATWGNGQPAKWFGRYSAGSYNKLLNSGVLVAEDEWLHIALAQNGSEVSLYVDSVLKSTANDGTGAGLTNPPNVTIGANLVRQYYFDGTIDDVRIYNRALSGEEVLGVYELTD
ncbi:MAG: LamG domain-containing protein [Planctomycetota bacterium]